MTNVRFVPILLFLPLTLTSLGCPTRTVPFDSGAGGSSETDGSAGKTGVAGTIGGRAGVGGELGGAAGGVGGAGGHSVGGGSEPSGGSGGIAGGAGTSGGAGRAGKAGSSGTTGGTSGAGGSAPLCAPACAAPTGGTSTCVNGSCVTTCTVAGQIVCGTACIDKNTTASDANNCGSCGHSCAGGTCSGGVCQALSLGTIPSASAQNLVLSGGFLYAITADAMTTPSVWQLNPNAASTPITIAPSIPSPTSPRCIMDGKLFWAAPSTGSNMPSPIMWCSVANCTATTATLLISPGQAENPVCDTTTDELVWDDFTYPYAGATVSVLTIYRVATNGTNRRTMTSFYPLEGADTAVIPGFVNGRADRFFFDRATFTPSTETVFYVLTNSAGVSPVSIASGTAVQINLGQRGFANDTLFVWSANIGSSQISYNLPLPNGVTGTPPVFYQGYVVDGIMDDQNLYGTFTTLPGDAIGICPISNCTSPAVLFRGQQYANGFTQDSTAIYWTTPSATGGGFTVWKGAK